MPSPLTWHRILTIVVSLAFSVGRYVYRNKPVGNLLDLNNAIIVGTVSVTLTILVFFDADQQN